jgi:hypothetical protein
MKYLIILLSLVGFYGFGQKTCTSNPTTINSNINFGSIVWTATGGATVAECNDMADGIASFTGNVIVDLANNTTITISNNVNIVGNFPISGGNNSVLSVTGPSTLHVTGDLGDADNNGVQYNVASVTSHIIVDGTLYGKNDNAFTGSGTISGGTLDVKNNSTCGSPCPVAGGFSNCVAGDGFCSDFGVLPITLTNFEAKAVGRSILLKWSTATEINFDYFSLQRSADGLSFSTIAKINGHGTTTETQHYSFEDRSPMVGKNYYRLQSTDFDGYQEIFEIIVAEFKTEAKVYVYPQPATDGRVHIDLLFSPSASTLIRVLQLNGVEVLSYRSDSDLRSYELDLNPGMYILKVSSGGINSVQRIIVK